MEQARARVVCLVTIHGIGFQQPPMDTPGADAGVAGYADDLHRALSADALLGPLLSDDPLRPSGGTRPIYVQSRPPSDPRIAAAGPDRLGTWGAAVGRTILTEDAPLVTDLDGHPVRVAHIALVYADLEERTPKLGSSIEAAAKALFSLGRYTSLGGLIALLARDAAALFPEGSSLGGLRARVRGRAGGTAAHPLPTAGLRVRTDAGAPTSRQHNRLDHQDVSGLPAIALQLENDVAAYVSRNDLRTRVRGFVRDALCRLAYRSDVEAIVVNAYSNGSPIAYDVLHELTPNAVSAVRAFITAGSPLRKYVDLFYWGTEVGNIARIVPVAPYAPWLNFWDPRDPVADPLAPGIAWQPGQSPAQVPPGLFQVGDDPATLVPARVTDYEVDNLIDNHGGGLRAHRYWDNQREFVPRVAALLSACADEIRARTSPPLA